MQDFPLPSRAQWPSAYEGMISWRGVAKKRRAQEVAEMRVKCSESVAAGQQSWRRGNHKPNWMLEGIRLHSRGAISPELCLDVSPGKSRAQGKPGACCTRSLACKIEQSTQA